MIGEQRRRRILAGARDQGGGTTRSDEPQSEPAQRRPADQVLELLGPSREKPLRRFPRLVIQAIRITWRAARRPFTFAAILQLGGGLAVRTQLLLAREVLNDVLAHQNEGDFSTVVGPLALLALVTTVISFASQARSEQQRLVGELTARAATSEVLAVATEVDLISFEIPAFHDRLRRASVNATARPSQMAGAVLGLTSSVFAIAGVGAALLFIQPLFLGIVAIAYVPTWLVGIWTSRLSYSFELRQTERDRRRMYCSRYSSARTRPKRFVASGSASSSVIGTTGSSMPGSTISRAWCDVTSTRDCWARS